MKNETALVQIPSSQDSQVLQQLIGFDLSSMQKFYEKKEYLQYIDATDLLNKCILAVDEQRHYDGTYTQVYSPHHICCGILGEISREYVYEPNYTEEQSVFISCTMLIEKLDLALYLWRELNPTLFQLLSMQNCVELSIISNWVKMVYYICMNPPQQSTI